MNIIAVDINVEEMPLADPTIIVRLNLCLIYLRMALRGLCGVISKIKVAPTYGSSEPANTAFPELTPYELQQQVEDAFDKAHK